MRKRPNSKGLDCEEEEPVDQLLGYSITYRIAVGPQQGRKVFTLQTLPACDSDERFADTVGNVSGFSLHAGVAIKAHQREKLERLCRYITRPAISEKRLSPLMLQDNSLNFIAQVYLLMDTLPKVI